jgi:hypothetical protein
MIALIGFGLLLWCVAAVGCALAFGSLARVGAGHDAPRKIRRTHGSDDLALYVIAELRAIAASLMVEEDSR